MAIFRFEAKIISRGQQRSTVAAAAYQSGSFVNGGKSAVKAAAYRAGESLIDERNGGERADYSNKRGVLGSEIMLPEGVASIFRDRQHLWNAVEAIERRKDAQLAKDFIVSLPWEMTQAQRVALTRAFVKAEFCDKGLIADIAWHAPDKGDPRNYHCHIMVPLRRIEGDAFARRKDRPPAGEHPAKAWAAELLRLREAWADMANEHLAAAGLDIRIDHRSLAERGIDREPEPKIGPLGTKIEREGRESLAANDNREVRARNAERAQLKTELAAAAAEEALLIDLVARRLRSGDVKPEPVSPEDLKRQFEQEQDALLQLQQQDERLQQQQRDQHAARIEAFKREQEAQAEEAKKQREQNVTSEAARQQEGEIANARARYSVALADHYDIRDPYGSLARAAMAEYGALVKSQEQLRIAIAKEPDVEKRRLIELRKEIEAHDYMALSSQRLAGISADIAGRPDAPQAILHAARGDAYAERSAELRQERATLIAARQLDEQGRQGHGKGAPGAQPEPPGPVRRAKQQEGVAQDESGSKRPSRQQTGVDPHPSKPAEPGRTDTAARGTRSADDKQREEDNRAKVTGRKEGDAELSDAQRAKLDKLNATREAYAQHNAQKQKDRDRGGGRGGR